MTPDSALSETCLYRSNCVMACVDTRSHAVDWLTKGWVCQVPLVCLVCEVPWTQSGLPMEQIVALGRRRGQRPSRALLEKAGIEPSAWDSSFFLGNTGILMIDREQLRRDAVSPGPLPGLCGSPKRNRSYIITGLALHWGEVDGDVGLMRRKATGDLGLQTCAVFPDLTPEVQLPGPEGRRSQVQTRASKCVVGLVKLLRVSVPGFWSCEWSRYDLDDFLQDRYRLSMDAVVYLTGVLKWAMIVREGRFLHDTYLAHVWAQAQGIQNLGSGRMSTRAVQTNYNLTEAHQMLNHDGSIGDYTLQSAPGSALGYPVRGPSGNSGSSGQPLDVYIMVEDTLKFVETLLVSQRLWPDVLPDAMPSPGNLEPPRPKPRPVTPTVPAAGKWEPSRGPKESLVNRVASKSTRAASVHSQRAAGVHGTQEHRTRALSVRAQPAGAQGVPGMRGVHGVQGVPGVSAAARVSARRREAL